MTIVSIRGTHGSGKSTIVRKILDRYTDRPYNVNPKGKPDGYEVDLPNGDTLFVVGPYHTACGGCDAIQPYARILDLINYGAQTCDHVLLEGALVSSSYGTVGNLLNHYATVQSTPAVFAFLDTTLETCLDRIKQRRAAKGNFEPLNPTNTAVKFDNVARTKQQMAKLGSSVRIVDIDHRKPTQQVLRLFGVQIRKEL